MAKRAFLDINDTYSLRGIAMLMIIISHAYNGYPADNLSYYFPQWMCYLHMDLWGGMGVGVFFFLSGFGLFHTLNRVSGIDASYILAKAERLLKPYLIYWVIEVLVLALFNRAELTPHLFREFFTFSIHPDVENWFFKVIVIAYIVTIFLFKCKICTAMRVVVVGLLSVIYLLVMSKMGYGQWWYNTILCFPVGALVAHRYEWFAQLPALQMSVIGCILMSFVYFVHMNTIVFHFAFVLFCIYFIRVVLVQHRFLSFIGYNSFIFYFIECPVLDEIMMFSYPYFSLYVILSLVGTFVLSFCVCRLCLA